MSYAQFGYAAFTTPTTQLMVGTSGTNSSSMSSPCCGESGRTSSGLPTESQGTVCSLPATYDSRLLTTYPRLGPSALYAGPAAYTDQPYANFDSSAFYPSLGSAYGMKDTGDPWRGIAPTASYYYDPSLAAYGYGGLDFNGARRKNVTRDSTSTLKAWLNEHRKNPYPTKGEKIMLAIITKMTLTQVSTWFANARRRLKKENKMTWEPRNKMDSDDVKDFDDDDDDEEENKNDRNRNEPIENNGSNRGGQERTERLDQEMRRDDLRMARETSRCESEEESDDGAHRMTPCDSSIDGSAHFSVSGPLSPRTPYHLLHRNKLPGIPPLENLARDTNLIPPSEFTPTDSSSSPNLPDIQSLIRPPEAKTRGPSSVESSNKLSNSGDVDMNGQSMSSTKPKIWSLADTATSKSPGPAGPDGPAAPTMADMLGHCGWFSVNPYHQVNGAAGLAGYHHHHGTPFTSASGSGGGGSFGGGTSGGGGGPCSASSHGFGGPVPPQTDTPPQTPPNMKVSNSLPLSTTGYLGGQNMHLYQAAAVANPLCPNGALSSAMQAGKPGGIYHLPGSRPYRTDTTPEDYSSTGQFRPAAIQ